MRITVFITYSLKQCVLVVMRIKDVLHQLMRIIFAIRIIQFIPQEEDIQLSSCIKIVTYNFFKSKN